MDHNTQEAAPLQQDEEGIRQDEEQGVEEESHQTGNILVADDMPANLRLLTSVLRREGYTVYPASDGEEALHAVQAEPPDLLLLDVMMPRLSGYEVCRHLKEDPRTRDIPVIFISALGEMVDKMQAFKLGAVDYITKPFQMPEVLARVRTHMKLHAIQQQMQAQNEQLQREVAERERAEAALQAYARELELRNEELDAFAYMVAHDLREPLSHMVGYAETLEQMGEQIPAEKRQRSRQIIARQGKRMANLVDELLLLMRIRKVDLVLTPVDVGDTVAAALEQVTYLTDEYQAEITQAIDWPQVLGFAPGIKEVWANYLSNALKYGGNAAQQIPPRIEIGWEETTEPEDYVFSHPSAPPLPKQGGTYIRCYVRDNGPGIQPEDLAQLFRPFTRLDEMDTKGFGLGLSIALRIVHKMGGQVYAHSTPGEGSEFGFLLPKAQI